jgi:hypothetical protein
MWMTNIGKKEREVPTCRKNFPNRVLTFEEESYEVLLNASRRGGVGGLGSSDAIVSVNNDLSFRITTVEAARISSSSIHSL